MDEFLTAGRITLYLSLLWTVYVGVKAVYEIYRHEVDDFRSEHLQYKKDNHRRVHQLYLIGAVGVCIGQLVGYLWFDLKNTGLEGDDRGIGVFNILFINLYLLFTINHFKHERKGTAEKGTWKEILKF